MKGSQDLMNAQFSKAAFGYRQDEVDDYVRSVAATIRDLTEDNKDLEEKLEVLASKLEEYREDEESLRSAILGAQKLGDKIIRDSQSKAEVIIREATTRADRLVETAQRKIEREQVALSRIQKEVADFKNRLLVLYKQHLELISSLPADEEDLSGFPTITFTLSPSRTVSSSTGMMGNAAARGALRREKFAGSAYFGSSTKLLSSGTAVT